MNKKEIAKKVWANRSKNERTIVALKAVMTRKENEYKRSMIAMKAVASRNKNVTEEEMSELIELLTG